MNQGVLMGRLTKDPELRSTGELSITRYTLAVDRRFRSGEADFIPCVAFGKAADFADKYFRKGMRVAISGRIQTGSYEGKNGKVYTTEVIVEDQEFAQNKEEKEERPKPAPDDFMTIPDDIDEELPFGK